MITQERINTYKYWFENIPSFLSDEIENLWNLANYVYDKYFEVLKDIKFEKYNFLDVSLEENISLAQQFLDKNNINISVKELIESGILILKKFEEKNSKTKVGTSYYDKDKNRIIEIYLNGNITDSFILIHEIIHYLNQPEYERNFK